MPNVFKTDQCAHCGARHVACEIKTNHIVSLNSTYSTNEIVGACGNCGRYNIRARIIVTKSHKQISESFYPRPAQINIPNHLPPNIVKPFKEAEENFIESKWSSATAMYRKAVDRACSKILSDAEIPYNQRDMLGKKLGLLETSGLLPPSMIEWIKVIKDDGNFALHDEDKDFESKEEIEPARRFCAVLLEYLFTLPEEVKLARQEIDAREDL